ncbi:MAG: hypothetical protein OHK0022_52460 [Roseiflexaceae bacterium]
MAFRALSICDDELVRQYRAGNSINGLARQHQCHPSTIRRRLLNCGEPLRDRNKKLAALGRAELERLVQRQGMSDGQIGYKYAVSPSAVRNRRLRYGIASHPRNARYARQNRPSRPARRPQTETHQA